MPSMTDMDTYWAIKTSTRGKALQRLISAKTSSVRKAWGKWIDLLRDAVNYGAEMQMVRGREPDLSAISPYEEWKPHDEFEKVLIEERAACLFDHTIKASTGESFDEIVNKLADWGCIRLEGEKITGRAGIQVYMDAMKMAEPLITWNVRNRRAIEYAAANAAKLVTSVTEETKAAIRGVIARGIESGKSIPAIGRKVRDYVGLNVRQAEALDKYADELYERYSGMRGGMTQARRNRMDRQIRRESRKKLRYRADMIARTETSRAVNEGALQAYEEQGRRRVRFEAAFDACDTCISYDQEEYMIGDRPIDVPLHPNCRCTWVAVIER